MTASTKAAKTNIRTAVALSVTPAARSATSSASATAVGTRNVRRALAAVARRQAIAGPMPDSSTSTSASGTVYWSNHGGPTAAFLPVTASEMSGKKVPQNTTKASPTSTRLFPRKTASRDSSESSRCSERSASRRETTRQIEPAIISPMSVTNGTPSVDAPKAWIESRIPERTRNVPRTARMPVVSTSVAFQTFSIPRFSWIITECRNAVPVSHGSSDAFSTGSQAQ